MAVLACAVALARDTTGHHWYATYKLTVADLMIGAGFDEYAPVEYRNEDGAVETVSRFALTHTFEARWVRKEILEAAWNGATLGGLSGFGGALLCLVLVWRILGDGRDRLPGNEPAPDWRSDTPDRLVSPSASPVSTPVAARPGPAPQPPMTPVPDRLAASGSPRSPSAEPAAARRSGSDSGKDIAKAPARREGRNRDHGRWV